jgi:zinc protease
VIAVRPIEGPVPDEGAHLLKIKLVRAALAVSLTLVAWGLASAAPVPGQTPPQIKYQEYRLANGLQVLLHEDHKLPIVSVDIWYHVGPLKERAGRTGFAHLFEHMMFEGSKHVGEKSHFKYLEGAGATGINGTTDFDRTNYFETLPSNQLELGLWLESDRMGFLLDTLDRAKLTNQRDVVRNERRQGEGQPYGIVDEEVYHQLFAKTHPYYGDVIGSHADIEAARLNDVRDFFKQYYAPNNATIAIAGDYDPAAIRGLIEKYFGPIPSGPKVQVSQVVTAPITAERRKVVTDTVQLPKVILAWLSPQAFKPGDADADIAAHVLGDGKSSRLYKELVYRQQIAQSAQCHQGSLALVSVFQCELIAKPNVTPQKLEAEAEKVIDGLARSGPTPEEVEWARNKIQTGMISGLQRLGGFGGIADMLNQYNQYTGDPGYLPKDLARYDAITPASVQSVAARTLGANQRVVVYGVPGKKVLEDVPRAPADTDAAVKITPEHSASFEQAQAWRGEAPKPGPQRPLRLPQPQVFQLDNGLTVYLVERHELPIVGTQLVTLAGTASNRPDQPGLAGLTASLLTEGTAKRSAEQIANRAALLGTDLHADSGADVAQLSVAVLKRNLAGALELMADSAEHPAFPAQDLTRVRAERLTSLVQIEDNPVDLALRTGTEALFGAASPYGYVSLGTTASLHAITREQVAAFHANHYGPKNSLLVITGDVTPGEARTLAQASFGGWTSGAATPGAQPAPAEPRRRILLVDKPGAPQTALLTFGVGLPRNSSDYPAVTVMNTMLGGLFSSRINMNLREAHGYTYGAFSLYRYYRGVGPFITGAQVRTDVTAPALTELFKELDGIHTRPLTDSELRMAKDSIVRSLPGDFESVDNVNTQLRYLWIFGLAADYYTRLPAAVEAVTSAQVQEAAAKYVKPQNLLVVAVGDGAKIRTSLEGLKLAPLELAAEK